MVLGYVSSISFYINDKKSRLMYNNVNQKISLNSVTFSLATNRKLTANGIDVNKIGSAIRMSNLTNGKYAK